MKRPASALEKALKRHASALGKAEKAKPKENADLKGKKENGKTSLEKEVTGTTEKGGKLKLIVEVSGARCPKWHSQMIDEIWTSLEKEALTKSEARDLREKLCKQWGANW